MKRALPFLALFPVACVEAPVPPVDDALPSVLGLAPAEDLDPAVDAVEYEISIAEATLELVPGKQTTVMAYNGQVPGPLLQARVGDHVKIRVTNNLSEPTTIHWHGVRVPNAMDGVIAGTMIAIEPGTQFVYEFVPPEAGTFWYHPHIRTNVQVEAGLQGVFVVHEAEGAPDVDADRLFVLDDVAIQNNGSIVPPRGGMDTMHGRVGNEFLINGSARVPDIAVAAGRVERWRFVNTANAYTHVLRFPGLDVREIGADGGLWPQRDTRVVSEIVLPAGARAELEVRLVDAAAASLGVQTVTLALDANDDVIEVPMSIIAAFEDKTLEVASDKVRAGYTFNPPFDYEDVELGAEKTLQLSGYNDGQVHFTINGKAWPEFEEWTVPLGSLQVITVQNMLGMEHPFHLHGQWFQILKRGSRVAEEPGLRDTVLVPGQQRVTIAVRFENPGMWMYHCHILEHEEAGMMGMVMVE